LKLESATRYDGKKLGQSSRLAPTLARSRDKREANEGERHRKNDVSIDEGARTKRGNYGDPRNG